MLVNRGRDSRENIWYYEVDTEEWQKLCIKKPSTCVWMNMSCISVIRCVNLLMRNDTVVHCFLTKPQPSILWMLRFQKWVLCPCLNWQRPERSVLATSGGTRHTHTHTHTQKASKQQYARNSPYFFLSSLFYTADCSESCNGCFQLIVE